jgi:hypothetical protein
VSQSQPSVDPRRVAGSALLAFWAGFAAVAALVAGRYSLWIGRFLALGGSNDCAVAAAVLTIVAGVLAAVTLLPAWLALAAVRTDAERRLYGRGLAGLSLVLAALALAGALLL